MTSGCAMMRSRIVSSNWGLPLIRTSTHDIGWTVFRSAGYSTSLKYFLPRFFPIAEKCLEPLVGQRVGGHLVDDVGGRGHHVGPDAGGLAGMVHAADRGRENLCVETVIVVDG